MRNYEINNNVDVQATMCLYKKAHKVLNTSNKKISVIFHKKGNWKIWKYKIKDSS
jgi:hypothetical protein